jgi:glutamate/tyrosine decarboxylase-like PLP-dependent enzyme
MRKLLETTAEKAIQYLENLDNRTVTPGKESLDRIEQFRELLPESSEDPLKVIRMLDDIGSPATLATAGPRFFGFVIGGSLPAALAANWLAAAWDQNSAYYHLAAATSLIEEVALRWLIDIFNLPEECGGAFVTGATIANFTALAAARHEVLKQADWNVESDGLCGSPPITVVVSEEAHPTLFKSLGLLGLGRNRVIKVPVDGQGRMRVDALPRITGPAIVCTQAGNVNTGAFDPIGEICDAVKEANAWVHVDGAFGLWATTSPVHSYLTGGINKADSWATDAHKWLNVPYDSGITLVRHPHALKAAMAITAEYLPTASPYRDPSDFTPELSRRARGIEVWAALKQLGRKGVADLIERCCRHAGRFAEGLDAAGYDILNDVVLNQVLVSFGDPETTQKVIEGIQKDGICWCGGTVWQGQTAMRISISSWATTDRDVELSLDSMLRMASELAR